MRANLLYGNQDTEIHNYFHIYAGPLVNADFNEEGMPYNGDTETRLSLKFFKVNIIHWVNFIGFRT